MDDRKYLEEFETLKRFFETHCQEKHRHAARDEHGAVMRNASRNLGSDRVTLCPECAPLFDYALERLGECPHDPKPRCRNCPQRCYAAAEWKQMAKIMRYSGARLGLLRLRRLVLGFVSKD